MPNLSVDNLRKPVNLRLVEEKYNFFPSVFKRRLFKTGNVLFKLIALIISIIKKELSSINDQKAKDEMVKEFIDYYGKNIVVKSKLVTGVYEFLKWAKSKNISMGVCTNKQEHLAVNLLKKIKIYDFFEYVAGRNTFEYCKPDPRHLTSTIEIMNGSIKKSLMIGDSENDAEAAKSAGISDAIESGPNALLSKTICISSTRAPCANAAIGGHIEAE